MAPATLHTLRLPENPNETGDYSKMDQTWILLQPDGDGSAKRVEPGDLVCFPELITGAGEFEGLYFVLPEASEGGAGGAGRLQLVRGDVEFLQFPSAIVQLVTGGEGGSTSTTLREKYEAPVNEMLEAQGMDLEMVMEGCDGGVEGYWNNPDVLRRRGRSEEGEWIIPYRAYE